MRRAQQLLSKTATNCRSNVFRIPRSAFVACSKAAPFRPTLTSSVRGLHDEHYVPCVSDSASVAAHTPSAQVICAAVNDLQFSAGNDDEISNALPILAEKLQNCKEEFALDDLCAAFFGLQSLSSEDGASHALLEALRNKISLHENHQWNLPQITQFMFGLQGMRSDYEPIIYLIRLVTAQLERLPKNLLTMGSFADLMCGLHSMDSAQPEVLQLLGVLADKAAHICSPCHDAAILESVLHGMNRMDSDHAPVTQLLTIVNATMSESTAILGDDGVLDGLRALRLMDSESKEALGFVRNIKNAMARKNAVEPILMATADVVDVFSCLYGFSSDAVEVQELLTFVNDLFQRNFKVDEIETEDVYTLLELFGSFNDKSDEVRLLLASFRAAMDSLPFVLDSSKVSELMQDCFRNYDFQNCQEVRDIMSLLVYKSAHQNQQ